MKAVILAGGEGTRLHPLTQDRPKVMVPVVNRPLLEHTLAHLKRHHVDNIVLALCHLPDVIQSHFGDGSALGVNVCYVVEGSPLGTAGAVKNACQLIDSVCFVLNGDIFTDLDLSAMLEFHRRNKAKVTIALTAVEDPSSYGLVETDAQGRVRAFIEKPKSVSGNTGLINAGTYILEPEVLDYIPAGKHFMFERDLFPYLISIGEPVYGFQSQAYWIDVGTPERYLQLHRDLLLGRVPGCATVSSASGAIQVGDGSVIRETCKLTGPVVIGGGCTVEHGARLVGPVVIGEGCYIGRGGVVEGAVLWRGVRVGEKARVTNSVVGDNVAIADGARVKDGVTVGDIQLPIGTGGE